MNILDIQSVTKTYATHMALDNVSIQVPKGSIFGLLGPNGAGKTSLIRIVTQITKPDSGSILFNGNPLASIHVQQIGYLPEERGLYKKMEVGEQLLYFAQLKGLSRHEAIEKLKIWVEKFEIKSWWKKKVEELSKGMQQKIQFIATVVHQPQLIILDEPFSGFDPINANLITSEILELKAQGSTIIFSTHRMESVEQLCDHIALIHQSKKVLDGSVAEIKNRYRSHVFEIEHSIQTLSLPIGFELINSKTTLHQSVISSIKISPNSSTNELLALLLQQVTIIRFEEKLPSMSDIFIAAVTPNTILS